MDTFSSLYPAPVVGHAPALTLTLQGSHLSLSPRLRTSVTLGLTEESTSIKYLIPADAKANSCDIWLLSV